MPPPNTVCLITGANRGIGRGLTAAYLARPHHTVVATVRDPAHPTALSLRHLAPPPPHSSRLIVLRMDLASSASIAAAFAALAAEHGVRALDVVVANAGIGWAVPGMLADVAAPVVVDGGSGRGGSGRDALHRFVEVNAYGPFELFGQAVGLMREAYAAGKAKAEEGEEWEEQRSGDEGGGEGWRQKEKKGKGRGKKPRFVLVSSNLGSFGLMGAATGYGLYGASKALANFLIRWMALENAGEMVVCAVHPGPVKTDMGELAIEHLEQMGVDLKLQWMSVEESVRALQTVIDDAESKNLNGRFIQYDGTELPW